MPLGVQRYLRRLCRGRGQALSRGHAIRGADRRLRLQSDADHDLADRVGEFVVIRLAVVRHGRQVVHAHVRWLGADEERMVNCDHRAIPVGRIISVGRVQSQR